MKSKNRLINLILLFSLLTLSTSCHGQRIGTITHNTSNADSKTIVGDTVNELGQHLMILTQEVLPGRRIL